MTDPLMSHDDFDLRVQLPNHAIFVGGSQSGKTTLVLNLLKNARDCLHPVPRTILLYYDQHQVEYETVKRELRRCGIDVLLRQGCENLSLEGLEKKDHQTLLVIDDESEATASSDAIAKISTNGRHKNVSMWLIWHSLYSKHPASRIISQNSNHLYLLPSPRLASQVHTLDTQLRYSGLLSAAYSQSVDESERDSRYLLLDLTSTTPNLFRLRSRLTDPRVQVLYLNATL